MTFFKFLLVFFFVASFLNATMHEDAEDKKTSRWKLINAESPKSIKNIYDVNKKSRILAFEGEGTKYTYEFKAKKKKKSEYWLSWQMKFTEDFVIIVMLDTNLGETHLIYTPGTFKSFNQYGLGYATISGKWQTLRRNLLEDLAYFDNRIKTVSLKSFIVKGSGKIDDIMTQKVKLLNKKKAIKEKKLLKKKEKKVLKKVFKKKTNTLPILSVTGAKTVQLRIGEPYVEEGVSAYDKEDGEINVESIENIDIGENGRYLVLYMATDSDGNMALDKRYVRVGNGEVEETKVSLDTDDDKEEESEDKEIKIWEKALALREKELIQREKKSNQNKKTN